ncbi:MAG: universal stress protein, partial [Flavobacteriales bacterium]|nr:universal stress protein [Flavobacteriales bacterium]
KRADLLVMNAPSKTSILDRIFPHDIEYILTELPTDVLIVK